MLRTIFKRLSNAYKFQFIFSGLTLPFIFSSGEEESNWESSTARNAASFKEKVESGKIVPTEIRKKLEQTENRTVEEHSMLEKEKFVANRLEKVGFVLLQELEGFSEVAQAKIKKL